MESQGREEIGRQASLGPYGQQFGEKLKKKSDSIYQTMQIQFENMIVFGAWPVFRYVLHKLFW